MPKIKEKRKFSISYNEDECTGGPIGEYTLLYDLAEKGIKIYGEWDVEKFEQVSWIDGGRYEITVWVEVE